MSLRTYNLDQINKHYQNYENFKSEVLSVCKYYESEAQILIENIVLYYNNLFELKFELEPEIIRFRSLMCYNIKLLKAANAEVQIPVVCFVIELLEYNLNYNDNVFKLTGS